MEKALQIQSEAPLEALLTADLLDALARPTESLPTVACLSRTTLLALVGNAIGHHGLRMPRERLLAHLRESHLLEPLPLEDPAPSGFKLFAFGAPPSLAPEPAELLMATHPQGVACYFTALAAHGLTTQVPSHHHVALVREEAPRRARPRPAADPIAPREPPLGTRRFHWRGVPYFQTLRAGYTLKGVVTRVLSPRSWLRLTSREQSLLDTFHRPIHCGGLGVVWEAWETALATLDEARLQDLMLAMDDPTLWRRVGCILDLLGYRPAASLTTALAAGSASDPDATSPIPLFPHLPMPGFDPRWQVMTPFR
jgi:hypothetical protein